MRSYGEYIECSCGAWARIGLTMAEEIKEVLAKEAQDDGND